MDRNLVSSASTSCNSIQLWPFTLERSQIKFTLVRGKRCIWFAQELHRIPVCIRCDVCAVRFEPCILYGSNQIASASQWCGTFFHTHVMQFWQLHTFCDLIQGVVNVTLTPVTDRMDAMRLPSNAMRCREMQSILCVSRITSVWTRAQSNDWPFSNGNVGNFSFDQQLYLSVYSDSGVPAVRVQWQSREDSSIHLACVDGRFLVTWWWGNTRSNYGQI